MARIGPLEHLQMARRDCLAFNQVRQAEEHQALRSESVVLSRRHLWTCPNFLPYLEHLNLNIKMQAKPYGRINELLSKPLFSVRNSHIK